MNSDDANLKMRDSFQRALDIGIRVRDLLQLGPGEGTATTEPVDEHGRVVSEVLSDCLRKSIDEAVSSVALENDKLADTVRLHAYQVAGALTRSDLTIDEAIATAVHGVGFALRNEQNSRRALCEVRVDDAPESIVAVFMDDYQNGPESSDLQYYRIGDESSLVRTVRRFLGGL